MSTPQSRAHSSDAPVVTTPQSPTHSRTHSSDAPMVTLLFKTSTQWRTAIYATVAVSRLRSNLPKSATGTQRGLGAPEQLNPDNQKQNGSPCENGDIDSQASKEANQDLGKALKDTNPDSEVEARVEVLRHVRDDLNKQLDAYGIVLVLLAGITFTAVLQPPGSFKEGKLQDSLLVSLFMLLATLSFCTACTGLGAVMVGCAQLFRPYFYPKLREYAYCKKKENSLRTGFRKRLLGCCDLDLTTDSVDDIRVLAELCVENVYRIIRIRIYLGASLALCIAAYICGAFAVMVANERQRYLLIGAVGAGGAILVIEIFTTLSPTVMPMCDSSMDGGSSERRSPEQTLNSKCALRCEEGTSSSLTHETFEHRHRMNAKRNSKSLGNASSRRSISIINNVMKENGSSTVNGLSHCVSPRGSEKDLENGVDGGL